MGKEFWEFWGVLGVLGEFWGHPLAVSGQLAQSNPDASHHIVITAVY